ncbi:MAG: 23S rRNA (pseudouridine(1915)-N(3))-methyltransferase RlmH [Gammaproteobacteria bacterium]|nr:23S rRNA (pseudouridine(1915)-N(3))-methyltransferase RlmH [Gammaproteobacteria bacterium]HJL95830.1 23S rRNA (pseudouridine(1915)-N(3))-methyltransferase RlmH [SAR86 cluster bacterium]HJM59556.1 23S rRNA (pseudouridine(1915)-N(3))-methyltransferase RlmH [SAR86 cluster bacterium]|tara:strand:- start:22533 stop:23000 length:468 start_codon:yes stop_codon:yes gene_type:complete
MLISIVCIESSRPDWAKQAFESYESRFNKSININWKGCKPIRRNKNYNVQKIIQSESKLLLSNTKENDIVVSLDRKGRKLDTLDLKNSLEDWISSSNNISFIIGGPDGLSEECINQSRFSWSLSELTFPHSLVPVIIIEQLYRAWSITQNHPYHR